MSCTVAANAAPKKFINTFYVYWGYSVGAVGAAADVPVLGKYDLLGLDRWYYDYIDGGVWNAIRAVNPQVQIYLYQMGPEAPNYKDTNLPQYLNGLGRFDLSRGHSMGSLNGDNPDLFLLDANGQRLYNFSFLSPVNNEYWYLMDFGSSRYWSYWIEGTVSDVIAQPWVADGIFVDNSVATRTVVYGEPIKYSTNELWSSAMNSFVGAITAGLHNNGQKAWFNRIQSQSVDGYNAWLALDSSATPPDVVMEESAFATSWWENAATAFYSEAEWKRQVDILRNVKHSKIAFLSHTRLSGEEIGVDNFGLPVTRWQTLWYSMSSFLLGKNAQLNNAYFMFHCEPTSQQCDPRPVWFDEYDKIDLGEPVGPYTVARVNTINEIGGSRQVNVYSREFARGYVYVTPSDPEIFTNDNWQTWNAHQEVAAISLPQATKRLTHETLNTPIADLPTVSSIDLPNHHGAILLKVADLAIDVTGTPNPVPLGGNIIYNVRVSNNGPSVATGLTLSGLPGDCSLMPNIIASGGVASCSISSPATTVGTVVQNVSVSAVEFDPNTANNNVSASIVISPSADLAIKLTGPSSVSIGDTALYVATITNNGPATASAVTFTDALPVGLLPTYSYSPITVCTNAANIVTCNIASLATGASTTVTIQATVQNTATVGAILTNTATVKSAELDSNMTNNTAKVDLVVTLPSCTGTSGYSISGAVRKSSSTGARITSATVKLSKSDCASTLTTSSTADYKFSNLKNGTYIVVPSKTNCTFSPTTRSITVNNGNITSSWSKTGFAGLGTNCK
jgi:uncharacterized repeat protein (TIGR01451 family)